MKGINHTGEILYREYLGIVRDLKKYLERKINGSSSDNLSLLEKLYREVKNCQRCSLYKTRTNLVFGEGNPDALVMFVGEAPGKEEDLQGRPFVGAAGKLLRKAIRTVGISEKQIYIANILKCRPPKNRDPQPEEIIACLPYLKKQIKIVKPKIICTLGKFSTQNILNTTTGITHLRGKSFTGNGGEIIIPTYHPAACIYRPPWREQLIADLKKVKMEMDKILSGV